LQDQDELPTWLEEFTSNSIQVSSRKTEVVYRGENNSSLIEFFLILYRINFAVFLF